MNNRLALRLILPTMVASALLLVLGAAAAWRVHRFQAEASEILDQRVATLRAAEELNIAIRETRTRLNYFVITSDVQHLSVLPELLGDVEKRLSESERLTQEAGERKLLARVGREYQQFKAQVLKAIQGSDPEEQVRRLRAARFNDLAAEVLRPAQEYLDGAEEGTRGGSRQNREAGDRTSLGLLLLGACGAAAGLLAGWGLSRGIHRTIISLHLPIYHAAGRLNEVVGPIRLSARNGEPDELGDALRQIAAQVETVVDRLHERERESLRAEQMAALGRLAAGIAHELLNPLSSMKILLQSAAENGDVDGGLSGRDVAVLEEEVIRLEGLTKAFLDFARPPRPEKRSVDLRPLLERTVTLVQARARRQRVAIRCIVPETPIVVEADSAQMRQVLLNLLLNALEAIGSDGEIRVEALRSDSEGEEARGRPSSRRATVRVWDSGCGLPAGLAEKIFEPFISTKEAGMGLGLAACRRILEAHGGTIHAADRPGGGAVFTFHLPLAADPSEEQEFMQPAARLARRFSCPPSS